MAPHAPINPTKKDSLCIRVLGDLNLDTILVPVRSSGVGRMMWQQQGDCWRYRRRGGSWLLAEIINAAFKSSNVKGHFATTAVETYDPVANGVTDEVLESTAPPSFLNAATILGLFPQSADFTKKLIYRVDRFLGWSHNTLTVTQGNNVPYESQLGKSIAPFADRSTNPCDILVIQDTTGHFRRLPMDSLRRLLDAQLKNGHTSIVWHMHSPLAEGNLWELISTNPQWLSKTILVVNMECLRQAGMHLPRATSLEQESQLFVEGMQAVSRLKALSQSSNLIAHQHCESILLYDRESRLQSSRYHCPYITCDANSHDCGVMVGYTSILVSAIVRGLAWSFLSDTRDAYEGIVAGIKQGAVLDHLYFGEGFGHQDDLAHPASFVKAPYEQLFASLEHLSQTKWERDGRRYVATALPLPSHSEALKSWSRIEGFIQPNAGTSEPTTLDKAAEQLGYDIVRLGLRHVVDAKQPDTPSAEFALPDVPQDTVRCVYDVHGLIKTAYRTEIESFANIRRIMEKYLNDERWSTPLSIAVFGQPGSGKSFTVKQILQTIKPDMAKRSLEFNLSQFGTNESLATAFHKVQDEAVAGDVPLVCFDEFDAQSLEWLKFFLAPMQDGQFKAGESTYRIGRAIFVFAGGLARSWKEFYEDNKCKNNLFKTNKGPDFVSRLRGYLEIPSINCHYGTSDTSESQSLKDNNKRILIVRRAILLRSLLEKHLPDIFDKSSKEAWIDRDVVRAFLQIPRYEHEVRSMEAIIQMSIVSSRGSFHKSSLPSLTQLKMHVDEHVFCHLLSGSDITKPEPHKSGETRL